jgi:hypothetical protein
VIIPFNLAVVQIRIIANIDTPWARISIKDAVITVSIIILPSLKLNFYLRLGLSLRLWFRLGCRSMMAATTAATL